MISPYIPRSDPPNAARLNAIRVHPHDSRRRAGGPAPSIASGRHVSDFLADRDVRGNHLEYGQHLRYPKTAAPHALSMLPLAPALGARLENRSSSFAIVPVSIRLESNRDNPPGKRQGFRR